MSEKKHFNGLTPAEAERLAVLAEECGEVIQAVGKILRHGFDSTHPFDAMGGNNRDALVRELGDVAAATSLLARAGDVSSIDIDVARTRKLERVRKYLHHQGDREDSP